MGFRNSSTYFATNKHQSLIMKWSFSSSTVFNSGNKLDKIDPSKLFFENRKKDLKFECEVAHGKDFHFQPINMLSF